MNYIKRYFIYGVKSVYVHYILKTICNSGLATSAGSSTGNRSTLDSILIESNVINVPNTI